MTDHAHLSPSSSRRWLSCAGSLVLTEDIPDPGNSYSNDGTAMHTVAARCLTEHTQASQYIDEWIPVGNTKVQFDDEMASLVQGYVDVVRERIGQLFVETRVDFSEFVGVPDSFGTADAIVFDPDAGVLTVIDLKTGFHPVSAEGNSQLLMYALGALAMLRDMEKDDVEIF